MFVCPGVCFKMWNPSFHTNEYFNCVTWHLATMGKALKTFLPCSSGTGLHRWILRYPPHPCIPLQAVILLFLITEIHIWSSTVSRCSQNRKGKDKGEQCVHVCVLGRGGGRVGLKTNEWGHVRGAGKSVESAWVDEDWIKENRNIRMGDARKQRQWKAGGPLTIPWRDSRNERRLQEASPPSTHMHRPALPLKCYKVLNSLWNQQQRSSAHSRHVLSPDSKSPWWAYYHNRFWTETKWCTETFSHIAKPAAILTCSFIMFKQCLQLNV